MPVHTFRIVNVFAEEALAGNPLAVFEDARGMDEQTMQALALQFNLSETTFVLPSARATAQVRIFTPTFEMPFAGHPTLGTAHVVRSLRGSGDTVMLEMRVGTIPVYAHGDVWTLQANPPKHRPVTASRADGSTNVVSDRLNCSASACIVCSSMPRASSNTASGLPASASSAKTLTMRNV